MRQKERVYRLRARALAKESRPRQAPIRKVKFTVALCTRCNRRLGKKHVRNEEGVCGKCLVEDAKEVIGARLSDIVNYAQTLKRRPPRQTIDPV